MCRVVYIVFLLIYVWKRKIPYGCIYMNLWGKAWYQSTEKCQVLDLKKSEFV